MQVILKRDCLSAWQKALVGVLVVALSASTGCQRLGTAVSKYLPAKSKQVAAKDEAGKPAETSPGTSSPESTPMQNMGGSPGGGDFGGPPEDGTGDELQNFGDDTGASFDPANDVTLEAGTDVGPSTDPLNGDGTDQIEGPDALLGQTSDGSLADPAEEPQGDPGLAPTGNAGPLTNEPLGQPGARPAGAQPGRKTRPSSKRGNNPGGGRKSSTNPNNVRIEDPQGKPVMRLTANAVVPAQTTEGQRVGFSVEYQLQRSGLSPNGEYGLLIESAKNGRYGVAVQLQDEGTLQVGAVPQFRPTSGPFKAYLVQRTKSGMQRISNIVQFKTLY